MRKRSINKDGGATPEQEYTNMLQAADRRCQHEVRAGMRTGFARCPEVHLEKSRDPERKGICQLTVVTLNRTKKLYCQWHAQALLRQMHFSVNVAKRPVVEDANQVGMFS